MTIIDLGCGGKKQPGAYGVDVVPGDQVDRVCDLDQYPWPLPDSQARIIYATQVLEHLADRVKTMQEIYRICAHGALVYITVPDGVCGGWVQDPTHKSPWSIGTFLYFCPSQWGKNWNDVPYNFFGVNFRILDFWSTKERGSWPWGGIRWADNLTVILQVIKESNAGEL